jgi:hypothetical protein
VASSAADETASVTDLGEGEAGPSASDKARLSELRRKVAFGMRKKLEEDMATMLNAINEGDIEAVKLMIDQGFKLNTVVS